MRSLDTVVGVKLNQSSRVPMFQPYEAIQEILLPKDKVLTLTFYSNNNLLCHVLHCCCLELERQPDFMQLEKYFLARHLTTKHRIVENDSY